QFLPPPRNLQDLSCVLLQVELRDFSIRKRVDSGVYLGCVMHASWCATSALLVSWFVAQAQMNEPSDAYTIQLFRAIRDDPKGGSCAENPRGPAGIAKPAGSGSVVHGVLRSCRRNMRIHDTRVRYVAGTAWCLIRAGRPLRSCHLSDTKCISAHTRTGSACRLHLRCGD